MKESRINKISPSTVIRAGERDFQNRKILLVLLVFVLSVLSIGISQGTLGRFSRSFIRTDSALTGAFDVTITPAKEFWVEQGEQVFEYYFLSEADIKGFAFQVANQGETDIRCKPYINGGLTYRVYVAEEVQTEFVVGASETVEFWLVIAPDGLDAAIRNVELLVDIQQLEGRESV